jgi:hypothetical protein
VTGDETDEVLGMVQRIGPVILSAAVAPSVGIVSSSLRRAVGFMIADPTMIDPSAFAFAIGVCLDLARHSGATLITMDRVRKAALGEKPLRLPGLLTQDIMVRMTLATEARIVAFMSFRSREEVETIAKAMNEAFRQSEEVAADNLDQGAYMALIGLHGTIVKHLADRGRQLPRLMSYKYQMIMPALRMAQRVYTDPSRYRELVDENNVVHPAFMPAEGKMLAV